MKNKNFTYLPDMQKFEMWVPFRPLIEKIKYQIFFNGISITHKYDAFSIIQMGLKLKKVQILKFVFLLALSVEFILETVRDRLNLSTYYQKLLPQNLGGFIIKTVNDMIVIGGQVRCYNRMKDITINKN
jgi:hypothetical protein